MIKLENVHKNRVIDETTSKDILYIIEINNATSIEDIIKLRYQYPQLNWNDTSEKLIEIANEIYNNNHQKNIKYINKNPKIYTFEPYKDKRLNETDKLVKGSELIMNPTTWENGSICKISWLTIKEIKEYLAHTDEYGKNYLEYKIRSRRGVVNNQIEWILHVLAVYENQVIAQSKLTDKENIDLFHYHTKEKKDIIKNKYKDIINYLLDKNEYLEWGTLTDAQKKKLISTIINNRREDKEIKERVTTLIANYTILPELEKITTKPDVALKKLIKKSS